MQIRKTGRHLLQLGTPTCFTGNQLHRITVKRVSSTYKVTEFKNDSFTEEEGPRPFLKIGRL